jgi:Cysteine-rich secretory protein family
VTSSSPRLPLLIALALTGPWAGCGLQGEDPAPGSGGPGGASGYGVPVQGFPSWRERTLLALTNAVRMAPLDWRARYGADFSPSLASAGALDAYPAVSPLRWNLGLNRSARAHSEDMARTPCWGHDSCDGTSWSARIRASYTLSGAIGENIAAGYPAPADPRYAMNMWLCDASGAACCADGASCDGHRRNIMSGSWRALGTGYGYAAGSPYQHYWTQDFGGASDSTEPPLVDGSHVFVGSEIVFLANWFGDAPRSMSVVVDGAATPLALDLGGATRGTWSARLPRGSACRAYHLEAVDAAGTSWRYPATGEFRTFGEGTCTEDWLP